MPNIRKFAKKTFVENETLLPLVYAPKGEFWESLKKISGLRGSNTINLRDPLIRSCIRRRAKKAGQPGVSKKVEDLVRRMDALSRVLGGKPSGSFATFLNIPKEPKEVEAELQKTFAEIIMLLDKIA